MLKEMDVQSMDWEYAYVWYSGARESCNKKTFGFVSASGYTPKAKYTLGIGYDEGIVAEDDRYS